MKKQLQPLSLLPLLLLLQIIDVLIGTEGSSLGTSLAEIGTAALLGSAGINLLGSALGGLFGSKSQQSANEANIAMQRETNELNYKMYKEQEAFQRQQWQNQLDLYDKMWKQQTEYNDPMAQVARYRKAGINPLFAMGNISSGQVSTPFSPTAPSAPSASPAVAPKVQAYDPTGAILSGASGVSSAITDYYNNDLLSEKAKAERINNITRLQENKARIAEILSRKDLNKAERNKYDAEANRIDYLLEMEFKNLASSANLNNEQANTQIEQQKLIRAEARMRDLSADYQEAVNNFLPNLQQAELEEVKSRIAANNASAFAQYENGKLSKAQAATEAVNKSIRELEKKGVKIDLKNKPKMISLTLKGMKYQNDIAKLQQKGVQLDNRQKGADYWNPFKYVGPTGASAAGAALLKVVK